MLKRKKKRERKAQRHTMLLYTLHSRPSSSSPTKCICFCCSSEHGRERSENDFFTGDGESHVVVEAELFLGSPEKALKLGVSQEGDGDNVPAPVLAHVDGEVAFGNVERESVLVVAAVFLA
ncbi:hypothetical protein GQ457_04G000150 [Hibiscus cannabinus]